MDSQNLLEQLFPSPRAPRAPLAPSPWPGVTAESTQTLAELLRANHIKYHCFFNDSNFHNHLVHHLLAAFALGCTPTLLNAAYKLHADYQRALKPSPSDITEENWTKHLAQPQYYPGYLSFFQNQILQRGMAEVLEAYVFSPAANKPGVDMFARFFSGLVHPLIHFGHGPEFGLPGIAAEGLAMTAVSKNIAGGLFPPLFFEQEVPPGPGPHALSIAARLIADPELAYGKGADPKSQARFQDAIKRSGDRLREYYAAWSPEGPFTEKYEELVWLVCAIYGFSGWKKGKVFQANFFMLHLVTSSLFVSSIHDLLTPRSQKLFLRGFLATSLTYYVGHGRISWDIAEFFAEPLSSYPMPPQPDPSPASSTLDRSHINQNPWFAILQSALSHPDEHLIKIQRSLAHYAARWGQCPKGHLKETELKGAENIDGSLFLRLAILTGKAKAWVREGEPSYDAEWNRDRKSVV